MKRIILSIFTLSVIFAFAQQAKAQFVLSGEFRPRFEFRDGYKKLNQKGGIAAFLISQRTRLNMGYKNDWLTTKLSIQDVRVWGDEPLKTDVPGTALYEAWAEFKVCDSMFIRAGRQEFIWDNERLLSNTNWQQKGLVHDAVLIKYRKKGWSVDFAGAFNQSRDTTFSTDYNKNLGNYKTLNFLIIGKQLKNFNISLAGFADGYQKKGTINTTYLRATYGGVFSYKTSKINTSARGFYQSGQNETGNFINAYYGNADFAYTWSKVYTLGAGAELQSGNDGTDVTNNQVNYFSCLYGTGHKFNGFQDFFTKPGDTKNAGLLDIYIKTLWKIADKWSLVMDFHYFQLQNNYVNAGKTIDKFLGREGDIVVGYDFSKEVNLQVGYSGFMPTKSMEVINGGNKDKFPSWAFAMLTVKPTFFKFEKSEK
ncbi:MAG: alginate export family protein [Bacteroidota bacterium]